MDDREPDGRGGGTAAAVAALADGPVKLSPLDLWMLLTFLGGRRCKEADKILRAKICDGTTTRTAVSGQQGILPSCRPLPPFRTPFCSSTLEYNKYYLFLYYYLCWLPCSRFGLFT